jgi:hypothetical protein
VKPKPRVTFGDLCAAYARVIERHAKGMAAMEAAQRELFEREEPTP